MIDARLLIPASAAWLGAATTLAGGPGIAVMATLLAIGVGWVAKAWRRAALVAAAFLLLGSIAALVGSWRLAPEPMAGWVHSRATAEVVAVVAGEPTIHRPAPGGPWWAQETLTVRIVTRTVGARGEEIAVAVPMRLRTSPQATVPPRGTVIAVSGRLAPVEEASGLGAELLVGSGGMVVWQAAGLLDHTASAMRAALDEAVSTVPPDAGALVMGLAIGDESRASEELTEAMRESGLAHLQAVSGGNIAIVVGVVVGIATLLRWPLAIRVLLGLAALVYYALLVGPEPSVLRASVMGAVVLIGVLVGGRRGGPSVLGAGVLGLVLIQPSLALSWGFALSAAAAAGIILLAPVLRSRLATSRTTARWPPVIRDALALTLAAAASTLPILVAMGGAVGWVSIPANMLAMPVVPAVTVLGLFAAVVGPVAPALATASAWLAAIPAGWIVHLAFLAPTLPGAAWPVQFLPQGWRGLALLALALAVGMVMVRTGRSPWWHRQPRWQRHLALGLLSLGLVLAAVRPPAQRGWPPPDWLVLMCDVGQGDAILLRAGPESAVVVDTGNDGSRVGACLADAGIRSVPTVVLTHFHADHVGGLGGLLTSVDVGAVLATPLADPREQAMLVAEVSARSGLDVTTITAGDVRRIGEVSWRALWPRRIIRAGSVPNNASVVLLATVRDRTILLTGDIEPEAQSALLADVTAAGSAGIDVVKVPHHGSVHQSEAFARAAHAPIALISVGADNDYGHPAPETVALYGAGGALVIRTDLHGDSAVVEEDATLGVVSRSGMLLPP